MDNWMWVGLAVVCYVGLMRWVAKAPPSMAAPPVYKRTPLTPRQREYEDRWAKYLHEANMQRKKEEDKPAGLSMSMFASKEDYEAFVALRETKNV